MPPFSPWGAKALHVLADGEWHERADILDAMAALVPPGKAFRTGERVRAHLRTRGGGAAGGRTRGDDSTSIATGKRTTARQVLNDLARNGRIERDGNRYRIRPAA